jgi:hypothetical protein
MHLNLFGLSSLFIKEILTAEPLLLRLESLVLLNGNGDPRDQRHSRLTG